PSTRSYADTLNVTEAPDGPVASAVMFAGTVTAGAVVSATVTVKVFEPGLPAASVAEHVTVVAPSANVDPDAGTHVGVIDPSTASVADAPLYDTTAPAALVASAMMFGGTVTTGPVVSWTFTVNEAEPVLVWASVAEQFTVVVPNANVEPDAGTHV